MVEPLEPAAADSVFSDDLLLDLVGDPKGPPHQPHFQDILDADGLPVLVPETTGEGDEEEEELEWLSNKEAFPAVETSFEISAERPSPVSVLSAAGPPFRVPVKARSKGKRRRRRVMAGIVLPAAAAAAPPARPMVERRRCLHCQSEETPQWRAGPEGPKTLCNACGVRYKSGRLVPEYRPANSPTFVAAVHSNSHRRIMEMRRRKSARGGRRGGRIPPEAAAAL